LKNILFNDVIRALNEPDKYAEFGLTIPNGMLLYGPPGCGKTFFAQKFAEEVGYNFVLVNPSDVQSKYINATQENINNLFKQAAENAPTTIFFDELDALVPTREAELHQMHAAAVNEFLAQMNSASERGIFVIAATNRPEKIDPALLRTGRIDKKFFIPPPDGKAREELFKIYMKDRPTDLDINYEVLSEKTNNYVSSDIKFIVDEASRIALRNNSRITMGIILNVIANTKPSVKKSDLLYYKQLEKKLYEDAEGEDVQGEKPFGFTLPQNNNEEK
jgi:transitional endoplasmic reticulum ATPase